MEESLDNWFISEILAHEEQLVRYLMHVWRNRDEVHDLRQDIYVRVLDAARKARPLSPKAFLFATARNLVADRLRRGRIVSIEVTGDMEELNVFIDEASPERRASGRQELQRVAEIFDLLPPKCREVMWLRRVDDLSQRDTAKLLGVHEKTVEKHMMRGMQALTGLLLGGRESHQQKVVSKNEDRFEQNELEHGQQKPD